MFEYGKQRSFEGIIERKTLSDAVGQEAWFPELRLVAYLLVAEGKHGADDEVSCL